MKTVIVFVPGLYGSELKAPSWLKFAKKVNSSTSETGISCTSFTWDFRRSLEEASAGFEAFVKTLGDSKIVLVTHSTGAMLVVPTINRNPSLFKAWYSVGGAIGPGPNAFDDALNQSNTPGWRIQSPVNVCLLNQATRQTFTTLYGFHSATDTAMQDAVTGKPIEGDLYDVAVWEKLLLGPWAGGADVSQEMRDHVENALASCRGFRKHLDGGEEILAHPASEYAHLKIVAYGSDSFKTVSVLNWREDKGVTTGDVAVWKDGDGTIQGKNWRRAFGGMEPGEVVLSETTHAELPNDERLHELVLAAAGGEAGGEQDKTRV
ncbi:hypothetical protein TeGR_g4200 [Tetraparma gracilis]|uniref:AB hydrolase-1 domain-containing protein n=1 Tax=Tetraparma gracilis TaxID=2962635 RepID=A0ABQ6N9T4_9STRA|nr:hypothetical protein TeGR_g4200 [Tetraparma gracilis]